MTKTPFEVRSRYALRKLTTGVVSIMIGLSFVKAKERFVHADSLDDNDAEQEDDQNRQQEMKRFVRMGRIIPVDHNQTAIKDAPTPHYRRDPVDPSKALPTKAPKVRNYKPVKKDQVDNYDISSQMVLPPNDPQQDTKLIYGRIKSKHSSRKNEPNNVETPTKKTNDSLPPAGVTSSKITERVQKKTRLFGFGRKKKKDKAAKEQETKQQQTAPTSSSSQENNVKTNTTNEQAASSTENTAASVNSTNQAETVPKNSEAKNKADKAEKTEKVEKPKTDQKQAAPEQKTPSEEQKKPEPKNELKPKKKTEAKLAKTPVIMNKETKVPPKPLVATLSIIDRDQDDKLLTKLTYKGQSGTPIEFSNLKEVLQIYNYDGYQFFKAKNDNTGKELERQSEKVVNFGVFAKEDVEFTIFLKHRLQKVTPDTDLPKLNKNELYRKVTLTVKFDGAGEHNPEAKVQTAWWTRNRTWDPVLHKLVKGQFDSEWAPAKTHYQEVKVPVVAGYHADRKVIEAQEITQEDMKLTVNYAPNAYFIPVDPHDKEIGHKQQFVTDSDDATIMQPDEKLPVIKGYQPLNQVLTPINPDEDLRVTYNPLKQVKTKSSLATVKEQAQATAPKPKVETKLFTPKPKVEKKETKQVSYIVNFAGAGDKTPDSILQLKHWPTDQQQHFDDIRIPIIHGYHTKEDFVKGSAVQDHNVKQTVNYEANGSFIPVDENDNQIGKAQPYLTDSSDPTKVLADEPLAEIDGYELKQKQATPLDPGKDQRITYYKKPEFKQVNEQHPNEHIKPDEYIKLVKLTVNFEGAAPNPKSVVQTMRLTRSITVGQDNKIVDNGKFTTDWKPEQKEYKTVKVPAVKGFHAQEAELKGITVTEQDVTKEVHYVANGHFKLVDEAGKEIAPAITFETDPEDASHVLEAKLPEIKGYQAGIKTIKPQNPATDQKVIYSKVKQYFLVNADHPNRAVASKEYDKIVHLVVNFIGGGDERPSQQVQKAHLTRNLTIDDEGKIVADGKFTTAWKAEPEKYQAIKIPVLKNYHTSQKELPARKVVDHDLEETVKYDPNGLLFL